MPQYIIERDIPGANEFSEEELRAMSEKARGVAKDLGPDLQWLHSYVTEDKIYCVWTKGQVLQSYIETLPSGAGRARRLLSHAEERGREWWRTMRRLAG